MDFDLVSDVHIDYWDIRLPLKYPCGSRKHAPCQLTPMSDILVVAGDVSDDITLTCEWLQKQSYNTILFVEGNHEHIEYYEHMSTIIDVPVINLSKNDYIHDSVAFVGCCGWWDYADGPTPKYFKDWMPNIDEPLFARLIKKRATQEAQKLIQRVSTLQKREDIHKIVIVTHTVPPKDEFCSEGGSTWTNTQLKDIFNFSKVTHWCFGHLHEEFDIKIDRIQFICHPRGRPDDNNSEKYDIKHIKILDL